MKKSETRNPKAEGRRPGERAVFVFRDSDFNILSDFGFRISDFQNWP